MIGLFALEAESAVAAGVRRVEALTGAAAFRYLSQSLDNLKEIGQILKAKDPVKAVDKLITENAQLKKQLEVLEARQLKAQGIEISANMEQLGSGIAFAGKLVEVANADALKKLAKDVVAASPNEKGAVAVLGTVIAEKPFLAIAITDGLVTAHQLDAGKWVKQVVAPLIKGGGGGQKNLAAAGGQDAQGIQPVIEAIRQQLTELA